MIVKLALRNLLRRRTQSLLAASAVAGGLALIIFTTNFQDGSWAGVVDDTIRAAAGHVVVQAEGYQEERDAALLLSDSGAVAEKVREAASPDRSSEKLRSSLHLNVAAVALRLGECDLALAGVAEDRHAVERERVDRLRGQRGAGGTGKNQIKKRFKKGAKGGEGHLGD